MKKVLITGVAGFLGSYLAKNLLVEGHQVIGIDNLSTGKLDNLKEILEDSKFTFIQQDVSDSSWTSNDIFNGVEEIFHLASPASPKFYQELWLNTMKVNTIGTKNVLELAKINNAKILFASTSEAYGDPEVHPQPEEYRGNVNTWGPRACYDEAKRMGEVLCYEYYTRYGVEVKVVRIFNTYSAGLRNDDGRVISNFVTQALTGSDITVYGTGEQTRSFCYVDDNIRALKLMMVTEEATGNITNIGNPIEYSILEVAELVKSLTNSDSKITFHELPKDDPKVRRPDITKAKAILGWEPEISLEEGLKRTIEVYKRNLLLV
ncbi:MULTISPECIES: UDP-glucuronic acid decarboxylase family protein [Bacillus cereus group]|uniref:UDP-glucuronic acid decarboxylase family protein n=1 Tax=Bacillus cereus group TaxID=86661 RepID=UPI000BF5FA6B|nr:MULTISPECIES: UDP-glucuronic acid decarboxylase family protein [Bacillus cereus group]MCU5389666.1 SDR family oxidoreductase [Bacillus paranthracis]PFU34804.1 NAD-dependent dehydratase [Bacillus cereus]